MPDRGLFESIKTTMNWNASMMNPRPNLSLFSDSDERSCVVTKLVGGGTLPRCCSGNAKQIFEGGKGQSHAHILHNILSRYFLAPPMPLQSRFLPFSLTDIHISSLLRGIQHSSAATILICSV
jgi:hypothetical protein